MKNFEYMEFDKILTEVIPFVCKNFVSESCFCDINDIDEIYDLLKSTKTFSLTISHIIKVLEVMVENHLDHLHDLSKQQKCEISNGNNPTSS